MPEVHFFAKLSFELCSYTYSHSVSADNTGVFRYTTTEIAFLNTQLHLNVFHDFKPLSLTINQNVTSFIFSFMVHKRYESIKYPSKDV